jgi:hypothetical protein
MLSVCLWIVHSWFTLRFSSVKMLPVSGLRGEDFFKSANQKQKLPVVAMFVNGSGQN